MSEAILSPPPPEPAAALPPARITVEQYHRMIDCGALTDDDRVELLNGRLVETRPQGPTHVEALEELVERCREVCGPSSHVKTEKPITFTSSEPEPDVAIVRGTRGDYRGRHPLANDCLLLIEVAETSFQRDLLKARIYAAGGVPEYWVVDLAGRRIITHHGATADGYTDVVTSDSAETQLPGGTLRVSIGDLLGG